MTAHLPSPFVSQRDHLQDGNTWGTSAPSSLPGGYLLRDGAQTSQAGPSPPRAQPAVTNLHSHPSFLPLSSPALPLPEASPEGPPRLPSAERQPRCSGGRRRRQALGGGRDRKSQNEGSLPPSLPPPSTSCYAAATYGGRRPVGATTGGATDSRQQGSAMGGKAPPAPTFPRSPRDRPGPATHTAPPWWTCCRPRALTPLSR